MTQALSVSEYRDLADALLTHWAGGPEGRTEDDPIYQRVTEGRDRGAAQRTYSSCGDLAHCMLWELGVRLPYVNHGPTWRNGRNVATLAWCPEAKPVRPGDRFECGDILIVWRRPDTTDAHVMVVLAHEDNVITTAEYGQPGGKVRTHALDVRYADPALRPSLGVGPQAVFDTGSGRALARVVRLEDALTAAAAADALEDVDGPALLDAWDAPLT